jgi:hypothetical protein
VEAGWADASDLERVPKVAAGARPHVILGGATSRRAGSGCGRGSKTCGIQVYAELKGTSSLPVCPNDKVAQPRLINRPFLVRQNELQPIPKGVLVLDDCINISAAVDIPKQALNMVDAFIAKDYLSRQLLPEIARLHQ